MIVHQNNRPLNCINTCWFDVLKTVIVCLAVRLGWNFGGRSYDICQKENTEDRRQNTEEYSFASIADFSLRSKWQARTKPVLWSGSLSAAVCCGQIRFCGRRLRRSLVWQRLPAGGPPDQRTLWSGCPRCNLSTSIVALGRRRQLPFHFVQKWAVFAFVAISILYLYWRYAEAMEKPYWGDGGFSAWFFGFFRIFTFPFLLFSLLPFFCAASFSNTTLQTYDVEAVISKCHLTVSAIFVRIDV